MHRVSAAALLLCWTLAPILPSANSSWGRFAVIPPVSNPRSRQNVEAARELEEFLEEHAVPAPEKIESRWHFWLPWDVTGKLNTLRCPLSIRMVALDAHPSVELGKTSWSAADASELARWICAKVPWARVRFARHLTGNAEPPQSCHVCLRRRRNGGFGEDLSLALRRALAVQLEELQGWRPEVKRSEAELELHVMLGLDGRILLEVPLLVQRIGLLGGLQQPGMKQVEAWAVAKSLDIQPGDVVLDPMCGKGTLLAEAAIWWPEGRYIGCDTDALQLESCRENHRHLRVEVETHLADASFEDGLPIPSCSVDKLMTAPPWDRQFQAAGGVEQLYPKMLREFQRVLRPHGRLAFLLNLPALEAIRPWLGNWTTQQCRFSMTRHTVGVLLLAQQGDGETLICDSWRNKDLRLLRGLWTKQRADERPWLRPANERVKKKRTAVGG
ncbi:unnamed protein product [Cladocopium goreaui]|uniref:THUMP domain-containing protein 2 n=1 Tax=Cladocopium goreaui TaxID=2562237 RepID=A0A9P1G621_9DINO|nr:unnamed protein product [Cladocopium goreaui]CAI4006598.1 unnamed protein product [Cladocopium goreaui]